jgi:lysophospholipase L1-like esterase
MRLFAYGMVGALLLSSTATATDQPANQDLPTVVLLGDSIRLSYAPIVVKQLAGKANVVSPKANGGDSANVLKHLDEWAIRAQPAIVHFNCGIHDVKKSKTTGKFQVSPDDYEANLRKIVKRLRKETKAKVVFALTTPLIDERAAKGRADKDYELLDASAEQYNQIARRVMQELDVPVNDLRAALGDQAEQARLIGGDGVHFTAQGSEKLGAAVASFVSKQLPAASNANSK